MNAFEQMTDTRSKIVPIQQIATVLEHFRRDGKKIVQCHGTFDLLHLGHIRHFKSAKKEGDVLVVALTSDRHVNKGPGRPVFTERLRAEFISELDCVDLIVIDDHASAVEAIKIIRPDVYAKGGEHMDTEKDATGTMRQEREAVESFGGRVYFTNEKTFSSSSLLNRHFDIYPEETQLFLQEFRTRYSMDDVQSALNGMRGKKVLLIGDAVIDEYHYVRPMGKTAKSNIIATRYLSEESFIGGIFACANHVAGFCDDVHVVTSLGLLDTQEKKIRAHLKPNVTMKSVYREDAPTTVKRRYVDAHGLNKLFEIYYFEDRDLPKEREDELVAYLEDVLPEYDAVIVLDYAHGLVSDRVIDVLERKSRFLAVNTQTNSANVGYNPITKYPRADFVCIDEPETRLATRDRFGSIEPLLERITTKLNVPKAIVTRGHKGCLVYDAQKGMSAIPVLSRKVVDAVGAGDAFLAITAPLVAAGVPMDLVGFIGNAVGAQAVLIVGNREAVELVPLTKAMKTYLA